MILDWIKKNFPFSTDDEVAALRARYQHLFDDLDDMRAEIKEMRRAFVQGGAITWDQLAIYDVSTPDNPIPYPTGHNVVSYRLPDIAGRMIFLSCCIAEPGDTGEFGSHVHPDAEEKNIQIDETAECNGSTVPPFGVTEFGVNDPHNYILPAGGRLITIFRHVPQE